MNIKEKIIKSQHILFDQDLSDDIDTSLFDPAVLQQRDAITGKAMGRGVTYFFNHARHHLVLRHYRRGGLVAKISDDRYIWQGLNQTRAWQEWHLMAKLHALGLPVPQPFAAHVRHQGLFYTADIITVLIADVTPLGETLKHDPLESGDWEKIGKTIRTFHNHGVFHADLNAHNILLTKDKVFLTDFDKGKILPVNTQWQKDNLQRLHRSLKKQQALNPGFHFNEADWEILQNAYKGA